VEGASVQCGSDAQVTDENGRTKLATHSRDELRIEAVGKHAWIHMGVKTSAVEWPLQLSLPGTLTAEEKEKESGQSVTVINADGSPVEGAKVGWIFVSVHPSKIRWYYTDATGSLTVPEDGRGAMSMHVATGQCKMSIQRERVAFPYRVVVPTKETKVTQAY
jgi:hypothetical protein